MTNPILAISGLKCAFGYLLSLAEYESDKGNTRVHQPVIEGHPEGVDFLLKNPIPGAL
jgi:hypothetical protein